MNTKGVPYIMNILLINGSPRKEGNTARALREMETVFQAEGFETITVQIGQKPLGGCIACGRCAQKGACAFEDAVNEVAPLFEKCDGLVIGSPVYYASANGNLSSFLDRLFYSTPFPKTMKVGAAVAAARRGGLTATFDQLNKYFAIAGMPIATGQYWNGVHGRAPGECEQDLEGMQMMRTLARNMSFLMKSIALGKAQYGVPEREPATSTNFIR